MKSFITQLVSDEPLLVVISDGSVFARAAISSLKGIHFQSVVIELQEIDSLSELQKLVSQANFFRLLVVARSGQTIQAACIQLSPILKKTHLYSVVSAEKTEPFGVSFQEVVSLLVVRDVVAASDLSIWQGWLHTDERMVVDKDTVVYPLLQSQLRQLIVSFIANPYPPHTQTVEGAPYETRALSLHAARLLTAKTNQDWSVITRTTLVVRQDEKTETLPTFKQLEKKYSEADIAQELVSSWKKYQQVATVGEKIQAQKPSKKPATPPVQVVLASPSTHHFPKTSQVHILRVAVKKTTSIPVRVSPIVSLPMKISQENQENQENRKKKPSTSTPTSTPTQLPANEELDQVIQRVFTTERVSQKEKVVRKLTTTTVKTTATNSHRKQLFRLSLVMAIFAVLFAGAITTTLWSFWQVSAATLKGVQPKPLNLELVRRVAPLLSDLVQTPFFASLQDYSQTSTTLVTFYDQIQNLLDLSQKESTLLDQIWNPQASTPFSTLPAITTLSNSVFQEFSLLEAELKHDSSPAQSAVLKSLEQRISDHRRNLVVLKQLQPLIPVLLAKDEKRTYGVVLVDDSELRPLGGVVQAVGFVSLQDGKVVATKTLSVTQLSAGFSGELATPSAVVAQFPDKKWSLSDMLWQPELASTQSEVLAVLDQASQTKVAGVIIIPTTSFGQWLSAAGGQTLEGKLFEGKNISQEVLAYSQNKSNPALAVEAAYTQLFSQFLESFSTLSPATRLSVVSAMSNSFQSQHAVAFLAQPEEETTLKTLGWSAIVLSPLCPAQFGQVPCVVDSLYQLEANLGGNKANEYVSRSINHTVALSRSGALHTRQTTLHNTSPSATWPAGEYSAQMQLYLPLDAQLQSIKIDTRSLSQADITTATRFDKQFVAFPFVVRPGQTRSITLEYKRAFSQEDGFSYTLFDQKQLGMSDDAMTVILSYSDDLRPKLVAPQAEYQPGLLSFPLRRVSHSFIGVEF